MPYDKAPASVRAQRTLLYWVSRFHGDGCLDPRWSLGPTSDHSARRQILLRVLGVWIPRIPRLAERARKQSPDNSAPSHAVGERTGIRLELAPFNDFGTQERDEMLPIDFDSYIELLRATAGAVYSVASDPSLPTGAVRTLERLGIRADHWVEAVRTYRKRFFSMIGCVHRIEVHCARTDRDRAKGSRWAGRVFRNCA